MEKVIIRTIIQYCRLNFVKKRYFGTKTGRLTFQAGFTPITSWVQMWPQATFDKGSKVFKERRNRVVFNIIRVLSLIGMYNNNSVSCYNSCTKLVWHVKL